jgi:hypothetical protein
MPHLESQAVDRRPKTCRQSANRRFFLKACKEHAGYTLDAPIGRIPHDVTPGIWGRPAAAARRGARLRNRNPLGSRPARKQTLTWHNGCESEVVVAAGELAQPVSCSIRRLIGK